MTALDYFRFVGALLLVLGLMVGMAYALRRWGQANWPCRRPARRCAAPYGP
ncbi:hypothetical protein [Hankyongella ginsenosidimutans]|uniref:hypothetical protein n=1 Tax=Hankyongella ginsenosidimutans TaxID=1763828 RepID=UPI001FECEA64|nr:hypothetical protein [Hankyongella ginsenosidimutans]